VLLKGRRTVIAGESGVFVNTTGIPWLGTAGAGDVLAGLLGALVASMPGPLLPVAAVGAWLHGAAATYASQGGPITAGDVATALPTVIADVLAGE